IRVLGTQFNVNARKGETEVVLQKGEVELTQTDSMQASPATYQMRPGELARWGRGYAQIYTQQVNPAVYTSWTKDRLVFEATALSNIADRIGINYGLEVRNASQELAETQVSGTVSNDNLPVLLETLSRLLGADIDRTDRHITIK